MNDTMMILHEMKNMEQRLETKLGAQIDGVARRIDGVEGRIDGLEGRFDGLEKRIDGLEARLKEHDRRFDHIDEQLSGIVSAIQTLQIDVHDHEVRISKLESRAWRFARFRIKRPQQRNG